MWLCNPSANKANRGAQDYEFTIPSVLLPAYILSLDVLLRKKTAGPLNKMKAFCNAGLAAAINTRINSSFHRRWSDNLGLNRNGLIRFRTSNGPVRRCESLVCPCRWYSGGSLLFSPFSSYSFLMLARSRPQDLSASIPSISIYLIKHLCNATRTLYGCFLL